MRLCRLCSLRRWFRDGVLGLHGNDGTSLTYKTNYLLTIPCISNAFTLSKRSMDLSTRNLEQALSIRRQIDALERRLRGLVGVTGSGAATTAPARRRGKRRLSASARAKIAAAARARWARFRAGRGGTKAAKKQGKRGGGITAAGRRRLSQLMKARWAARRKAKRK